MADAIASRSTLTAEAHLSYGAGQQVRLFQALINGLG